MLQVVVCQLATVHAQDEGEKSRERTTHTRRHTQIHTWHRGGKQRENDTGKSRLSSISTVRLAESHSLNRFLLVTALRILNVRSVRSDFLIQFVWT